jgi:hypothetical protein
VSCFFDSDEGTGEKGADLYATVAGNAHGILVTGLVFMVSAVCTVPAALGLAHLLRGRGVVLGHLGAASLALGAFGHFGYGFWQVLVSRVATSGDPAAVQAYLDRIAGWSSLLVPLMILVDVGIVLLCAGLLRAGTFPAWAPWLTIAGIAVDFGIQFTGVTATWPVTALWGLLTVTFGYFGVRVLGMSPDAWNRAGLTAPDATAAPVPIAV